MLKNEHKQTYYTATKDKNLIKGFVISATACICRKRRGMKKKRFH